MYVLEQRLSDPSVCDINELRSCVQILTNKGALNPAQTPICFTPKFGNNIDLARALPSKILFKMSCPAVMYPQLVASIYQLNCYGCLFSPAVVAISATALMFFLLLITLSSSSAYFPKSWCHLSAALNKLWQIHQRLSLGVVSYLCRFLKCTLQ